MMVLQVILLLLLSLVSISLQQGIDGIRLVNGTTYGSHIGRVEVLHNNTWGTICNEQWGWPDARAACRSLGYVTTVCAITTPSFPQPPEDTPVWISDLACNTTHQTLNDCPFTGFGISMCPQVGGEVICVSREVVGKTTGLRVVSRTDNTVQLSWSLPPIPEGINSLRWRIEGFGNPRFSYERNFSNLTTYSYIARNLASNTSYRVRVRTDVSYPFCRGYLYGNVSQWITIRTAEAVPRTSNISVRLVPPYRGVDFFGRVEVQYNNTWGTVCDHLVRLPEANVICQSLGFERALCYLPRARYGPGSGPIWIDNLDCSPGDEILEDCSFNDWGVHNCRHSNDVSVICQPTDDVHIDGLRVENAVANSVTLSWNAFRFPRGTRWSQYVVRYHSLNATSSPERTLNLLSDQTRSTISRLTIGNVWEFSVGVRYTMEYCRALIYAGQSESVQAFTMERAPSGPPRSVHVLVLNSTAVEVQWNLPYFAVRNGRIRGYKVFVQEHGSTEERVITVANRRNLDANEVIVGGLRPATVYTFSVLAYTVADGPRSIHLTVSTFSEDYVELIIYFGPLGNGVDRVVRQFGVAGNLQVHCGSGINGVELSWFRENQTEVSYSDRSLRQGRLASGTSILQIAYERRMDYCDAGVYTCRAQLTTNTTQIFESRNFTLFVGSAPPSPNAPSFSAVGSTWVTVSWTELSCDGGHEINELVIRYREESDDVITSFNYIYNLDPSLRNYTVHNLQPNTPYTFAVQAVSAEFLPSAFSDNNTANTLLAAPSAPQDVRARLVQTPTVEVSWREPASPNGIIVYYTVYATMADTVSRNDLPTAYTTSAVKSVPAHIGAVNVTVSGRHSDVQFQVSATVLVNGIENEGERSEVTSDSIVFVPNPDLPVPNNLKVTSFTNTSVTVSWTHPMQLYVVPIQRFQISYRGDVSWYSPDETLVLFSESGTKTVPSEVTSTTISQLIPDTEYDFRVSAVTEYGRGAEVVVSTMTDQPYDDKLAYFQLKLNPVGNCFQWKLNLSLILPQIRVSITETFTELLCNNCGLSPAAIQADRLYCDRTAVNQAVYRGRIKGAANLSTGDLIQFLETWVLSSSATVSVGSESFSVDDTCPLSIDSLDAPDCFIIAQTTTTSTTAATTTQTTTSTPPTTRNTDIPALTEKQSSGISSGQTGGIVIGVIIIILLLIFVILLMLLLIRSFGWNHRDFKMKKMKDDVIIDQDNLFNHNNPLSGTEDKETMQEL